MMIQGFIFGVANFTRGNVNPEPIETVIYLEFLALVIKSTFI